MMRSVCIVGTGLIGASTGLALRRAGFDGKIFGFDTNAEEAETSRARGAIDRVLASRDTAAECKADVFVLATPVLPVLDWMEFLAPRLAAHQLVTDVGSTKAAIYARAKTLFTPTHAQNARTNGAPAGVGSPTFLPGHPMAGKESGGAALADAALFDGATWLFMPEMGGNAALAAEWRMWVERMGAHVRVMDAAAHDEVCAWVSHLPQFVSTALAALLEDTFVPHPLPTMPRTDGPATAVAMATMDDVRAIGARALRETTRLGASPYSMWRDVAMTNTNNVAAVLLALEHRLAHLRENLRTPELRDEFARANQFRAK